MVNPKDLSIDSHPLGFVSALRDRYGDSLVLGFSKYRYSPRSRIDDRTRFQVSISDVNLDWCLEQMASLDVLQELALESRVELNGKVRHIPMLDFRGMTKGQLTAVMGIFPKSDRSDVDVYISGRSYHAYFQNLLTQSRWIKFMGSALLCNTPSDPSVVDQRWVGHRLISGYSALRWSCNTPHYKAFPVRVDASELDLSYYDRKAQYMLKMKPGSSENAAYFEGLVEWVLRKLGVSFLKRSTNYSWPVDFLVSAPAGKKIGIELVLSDFGVVSNRVVKFIDGNMKTAISEFGLSSLILISNSSFQKNGEWIRFVNEGIHILDEVSGPLNLLERLRPLVLNVDEFDKS